jgi:3-deoxy-D-manno-octulosonate 8-phosphate phosphatase (KDO 8-P phosphatase)
LNKLPKLILTDIDGVWTDGGMFYSTNGQELKKFNTSDSAGVLFCKLLNIKLGIVTGEKNAIVENRAKKLGISLLCMGVKNKVKLVEGICLEHNIQMSEVAYIGDDINDIQLLKRVGLSACPKDAPDYVKKNVDFCLSKKGGEGVFREFIEFILKENNLIEEVLSLYFKSLESFEQ